MDALILSCGTGGGHNAAGAAIVEELRRRGHRAEMRNPFTLHSQRLADVVDQSYVKLVQKVPGAFGAAYSVAELYRRLPFYSPVYHANGYMKAAMQQFLLENPVDIVISPHLYPAEIITNMKRHGMPVPKLMFVATDYTCIPFTEECECDAYVIPSEKLADEFIRRGIPRERIYPCGIPVHHSYSQAAQRAEARRLLHLDPEKQYILISGGSMGAGKMEALVLALHQELRIRGNIELIVICGRNPQLRARLFGRQLERVRVLGFTRQMPLYMRACDVYITKPGGLSSTEAAVAGIPLLHFSPIPGCETRNVSFFAAQGMSQRLELHNLYQVFQLLADPAAQANMLARQRQTIHPDAAGRICDLASQLVCAPALPDLPPLPCS